VTVGLRIARLEKRLGVTLLSRTPNGFATTSTGQAKLRQCAAMEKPRWTWSASPQDAALS